MRPTPFAGSERPPGRAAARSLAALLPALVGAWAAGACSASDCRVGPDSNPVVAFRGGVTYAADGAPAGEGRPAMYYETSTPDGEHIDFNGGSRFCIYHNLGRRPFHVEPWVSFKPTGVNGGNEAKPAGNMLEVLHVDECVIIVRNDSCGDYYLRVLASDPVTLDPAAAPAACDDPAVDRCKEPDEPPE
jgi:hypothetical protein